jgi:hypothetical protein
MRIDFQEETPEGTIAFKGEFNAEETQFIMRVGVMELMKRGALFTDRDVAEPPVDQHGNEVIQ